MSRPLGVTILAGLQFFFSGFGLLMSLALLLFKPFRDGILEASMQVVRSNPDLSQSPVTPELLDSALQAGAVGGIVVSLIGLLLGYGLLKLKKWAWICTLILQIIQILGALQGIFAALGAGGATGVPLSQQIFQLILSLIIVYYLFRPEVKQAFGR